MNANKWIRLCAATRRRKRNVFPRMLVGAVMVLTALAASDIWAATGSTLSQFEADQVVSEHNRIRKNAGVAVPLVWDNNLASYAQQWANNLAQKNGQLDHSYGPYGENCAKSSSSSYTALNAINLWEQEKSKYHGEAISWQNYMLFGHYTQMIWDRTTKVGCGRAISATGAAYVVCSYLPKGNMIGEKPITKSFSVPERYPGELRQRLIESMKERSLRPIQPKF